MDELELKLNRLLKSAGRDREDIAQSAPFGFDTRVVALWRAGAANGNGLARLVRRVAFLATAVIVISSAAAFREFEQSRDVDEPLTNEFSIADSEIQNEVGP
jgi:hypothetical protein